MNGPWDSYAPGTPESRSENWTQRVDEAGQPYWSYLGGGGPALTYEATPPPTDYGQGYATEPVGGNDSYAPYTAPGAPAQPAYDPLSSAYPVSQPAPYTGTGALGTPGGQAPYDPSTVSTEPYARAVYEQQLQAGLVPPDPTTVPAPVTDPYAAPAAADPYAAPAASTDPYTGLPVYEPAYSVSEPYNAPGGPLTVYNADPSFGQAPGYGGPGGYDDFGSTYPFPSFGQSAMNPGRQQPVIPGQFDPFAWSGNANPMPAPNETRQMILGAMQLGAEIEQQRNQQPTMNATNYALHRLGLNKPEEPAPQLPAAPPQRSRFGF